VATAHVQLNYLYRARRAWKAPEQVFSCCTPPDGEGLQKIPADAEKLVSAYI
jgi:hypothetical protein